MIFDYKPFKSITVQEAYDLIKNNSAMLIDVRESTEYTICHATGAINIPLSKLLKTPIDGSFDKQAVLVICASGGRSSQAASYLASNGVDVHNVIGGTNSWIMNNLPTNHQ